MTVPLYCCYRHSHFCTVLFFALKRKMNINKYLVTNRKCITKEIQ